MKIVNKTILFNDIKGSSKLWEEYGSKMFKTVKKLYNIMNKNIKEYKNKAKIIKMLGDSFMIVFNNIKDAIDFSMKINQHLLSNKGLFLDENKKHRLELRTGICYGEVNLFKTKVQGFLLDDYFGNVVNTASRMESKISEINGIGIGILKENEKDIPDIIKILETYKNYEIEGFDFDNSCSIKRGQRSTKLIDDISFHCNNVKKLQGIKMLKVLSVKKKK
jgi:hypothetical protein